MEDVLMKKLGSEFMGVRKGAWTPEEDLLLKKCVEKHGEGRWHLVPTRAGVRSCSSFCVLLYVTCVVWANVRCVSASLQCLRRCRKSCRLRWLNYLKPNIKKGAFQEDEVDLIIRLHRLLGNRWSLIAGRIPGRTANDIKNFWNSCLGKKVSPNLQGVVDNKETAGSTAMEPLKQSSHTAGLKETVPTVAPSYSVIKPKPRIPSKSISFPILSKNIGTHREARREPSITHDGPDKEEDPLSWLRNLLGVEEEEDGKQKEVNEGRGQENLNSVPSNSQEGNVELLVAGCCREEEGSEEGQQWWEDMFLDEELMLGDLLGPEAGSNQSPNWVDGILE
ncbi:hypothetical protein Taro_053528 [Colocasia esculenta]|uniref:Uncharacterized protein n=1 Tax=Colocasia esculenta TaxID=4460 RepID=A0A843XNC6_COLES|nr:hypothetical protein [Colocasia esculenta]